MTNEEMRKAIEEVKRHCLGTDCSKECPAYKLNPCGIWYCSINLPWSWDIEVE